MWEFLGQNSKIRRGSTYNIRFINFLSHCCSESSGSSERRVDIIKNRTRSSEKVVDRIKNRTMSSEEVVDIIKNRTLSSEEVVDNIFRLIDTFERGSQQYF